MKYFTFLFSLIFVGFLQVPSELHAQTQNAANISSAEMRSMLNSDRVPVHRATNTEGSPYLFEEFYEGTVYLKNGHTTKPLSIRYNTHEQSIDFLSNGVAFNVDGDEIDSFEFRIGEDQFVFRKGYEGSRLGEDDFVQVLTEGEVTFLARHTTNFFEDAASYGTATQQDRYRPAVTYYIKTGDENPNRLRNLNKRRVMRNIDRFEEEVEAYGEEHDIDFSEAQDVAMLLEYYNSLLEDSN